MPKQPTTNLSSQKPLQKKSWNEWLDQAFIAPSITTTEELFSCFPENIQRELISSGSSTTLLGEVCDWLSQIFEGELTSKKLLVNLKKYKNLPYYVEIEKKVSQFVATYLAPEEKSFPITFNIPVADIKQLIRDIENAHINHENEQYTKVQEELEKQKAASSKVDLWMPRILALLGFLPIFRAQNATSSMTTINYSGAQNPIPTEMQVDVNGHLVVVAPVGGVRTARVFRAMPNGTLIASGSHNAGLLNAVDVLSDNSLLVGGEESYSGSYYPLIGNLKADLSGFFWTKTLGSTSGITNSVIKTSDGNFAMGGGVGTQAFYGKVNSTNQNIVWAKTSSQSSVTRSTLRVAETSSGNLGVLINSADTPNTFILSNANGNGTLWSMQCNLGATGVYPCDLAVDAGGNLFVAFYTSNGHAGLAKFNGAGQLLAANVASETGYSYTVAVLQQTADGNWVLGGKRTNGSVTTSLLLGFDNNANFLEANALNATSSTGTEINALGSTATDVMIAGQWYSNTQILFGNLPGQKGCYVQSLSGTVSTNMMSSFNVTTDSGTVATWNPSTIIVTPTFTTFSNTITPQCSTAVTLPTPMPTPAITPEPTPQPTPNLTPTPTQNSTPSVIPPQPTPSFTNNTNAAPGQSAGSNDSSGSAEINWGMWLGIGGGFALLAFVLAGGYLLVRRMRQNKKDNEENNLSRPSSNFDLPEYKASEKHEPLQVGDTEGYRETKILPPNILQQQNGSSSSPARTQYVENPFQQPSVASLLAGSITSDTPRSSIVSALDNISPPPSVPSSQRGTQAFATPPVANNSGFFPSIKRLTKRLSNINGPKKAVEETAPAIVLPELTDSQNEKNAQNHTPEGKTQYQKFNVSQRDLHQKSEFIIPLQKRQSQQGDQRHIYDNVPQQLQEESNQSKEGSPPKPVLPNIYDNIPKEFQQTEEGNKRNSVSSAYFKKPPLEKKDSKDGEQNTLQDNSQNNLS